MLLLQSLLPIAKEFYNKSLIKPFNIILAASDIYYYENFHSDIMAYILENKKNVMNYFIDYVNDLSNASSDLPKIEINNYLNTETKREENKIDILIKDCQANIV
jgi:hypothetical protein